MADSVGGIWQPLRVPAFANLYFVYVLCFLSSAMLEATVAWDFADSDQADVLVALTSTAATLPIVLFILPSGALADAGRRQGLLRLSQALSAVAAAGLAVAVFVGPPAPQWILLAVALGGLAMALRLPALTSMVPEVIGAQKTPDGMALLGVATSLTRFIGPVLAATAIAVLGAPAPYLFAAILAILALAGLHRLPRRGLVGALPAERVLGALRVATQFARQSPDLQQLLVRGALFFFVGAAAQALGPLAASRNLEAGVGTFMAMIGAAGLGAVVGGWMLPALRGRLRRTEVARVGAAAMSLGALLIALSANLTMALSGSVLHGAGWLWGLATFTSLAQQSLPDWVRARGMALTQAALIGGVAVGAAFWGQVASLVGLTTALLFSALSCAFMAAVRPWLTLLAPEQRETAPRRYWSEPVLAMDIELADGPAVIQIEYLIKEGVEEEFLRTLGRSRRMRLRSGALSWSLFRDVENPMRFTEQILYESWSDRLRQTHRTTEADELVRDRKLTLLANGSAPRIAHWVAVRT